MCIVLNFTDFSVGLFGWWVGFSDRISLCSPKVQAPKSQAASSFSFTIARVTGMSHYA